MTTSESHGESSFDKGPPDERSRDGDADQRLARQGKARTAEHEPLGLHGAGRGARDRAGLDPDADADAADAGRVDAGKRDEVVSEDITIEIQHADVSLASPSAPKEDPGVRLYQSYSGGPTGEANGGATWCLQIRGGKRSRTPMFASGTLTRAHLTALRDVIDAELGDRGCAVGCGDCESCDAKNAKAKAAYDKANPVIGKLVELLPCAAASRKWKREHCKRNGRVTMIKRTGERFTVRAPDGAQRTFGPMDAVWFTVPAEAGGSGRRLPT